MTATHCFGLLLCGVLGGCSPTLPHVRADRDIFNDIAPRYVQYLENDQSLDPLDRATFLRTVTVWEMKVVAAEKAAGVESPARITLNPK